MQGWLLRRTSEQGMLILAGLLLVHPRPLFDALGAGLVGVVAPLQSLRRDRVPAPARAG